MEDPTYEDMLNNGSLNVPEVDLTDYMRTPDAPTDNSFLYGDAGYGDTGTEASEYAGNVDKRGLYGDAGYGDTLTDENQSEAETRRLSRYNDGDGGLANISPGHNTDGGGFNWSSIAKSLGLKSADGSYDLKKILGLAGAGAGLFGAATQKPQTIQSMSELRAGMPAMNAAQSFSPETLTMMQRPMQTGSALQRVYAADMQSPVTPGKRYAEGGDVQGDEAQGALTQAFAGAVQGDAGGQSDLIDAKLSPGEYVLDAETVSALGDGNTAAGVAKLDELRMRLRDEKRSAPNDEIPQQAAGPLSYMQGA